MNANQIINMVVRMVFRRVLNKGISAGINAVSNRKGQGGQMAERQPRQGGSSVPNVGKTQKRARQATKLARRVGRF